MITLDDQTFGSGVPKSDFGNLAAKLCLLAPIGFKKKSVRSAKLAVWRKRPVSGFRKYRQTASLALRTDRHFLKICICRVEFTIFLQAGYGK
ncbi:Uncharacterized protein dnm_043310 [Desulfonema magnum]|uniref:Uncharacterized protein n=1 Tax=Desulfonema magnum TaxID=45655 RepID=A0A975GNZ2_9BACT|nr:Uncharacterized protein dnm_043310 [Desulfonema magnum]